MHDTAKRLLEIGQDAGAKDFTEIAKWLGGSDQSATNWKTRGVPKEKILAAAEKFGVNVAYLRSGAQPKYVTLSKEPGEAVRVDSPPTFPVVTLKPATEKEQAIARLAGISSELDLMRIGQLIERATALQAEMPAKQTPRSSA